jgi:hypothetical protein
VSQPYRQGQPAERDKIATLAENPVRPLAEYTLLVLVAEVAAWIVLAQRQVFDDGVFWVFHKSKLAG